MTQQYSKVISIDGLNFNFNMDKGVETMVTIKNNIIVNAVYNKNNKRVAYVAKEIPMKNKLIERLLEIFVNGEYYGTLKIPQEILYKPIMERRNEIAQIAIFAYPGIVKYTNAFLEIVNPIPF